MVAVRVFVPSTLGAVCGLVQGFGTKALALFARAVPRLHPESSPA